MTASSSLAMQKDLAKTVMATAGVPVPEGLTLTRAEVAKAAVAAGAFLFFHYDAGLMAATMLIGAVLVNMYVKKKADAS